MTSASQLNIPDFERANLDFERANLNTADYIRLGHYQQWLRGKRFRIRYHWSVTRFWRVTWHQPRIGAHRRLHAVTFGTLPEAFDFCRKYSIAATMIQDHS